MSSLITKVVIDFQQQHPSVDITWAQEPDGLKATLSTSIAPSVTVGVMVSDSQLMGDPALVSQYLAFRLGQVVGDLYKRTVEELAIEPVNLDEWFYGDEVHETLDGTPEGWPSVDLGKHWSKWQLQYDEGKSQPEKGFYSFGTPQQEKHVFSDFDASMNTFTSKFKEAVETQPLWEAKFKSASSTPLYYTGLPYPVGYGKSVTEYINGSYMKPLVDFGKEKVEAEEFARELDDWLS